MVYLARSIHKGQNRLELEETCFDFGDPIFNSGNQLRSLDRSV